ncbi:MAG TPA: hypothetical protein VLH79_06625 [Chthonomonadales bacterium]|nr:hypothetical protein [Chthonomonadales bacterium]
MTSPRLACAITDGTKRSPIWATLRAAAFFGADGIGCSHSLRDMVGCFVPTAPRAGFAGEAGG